MYKFYQSNLIKKDMKRLSSVFLCLALFVSLAATNMQALAYCQNDCESCDCPECYGEDCNCAQCGCDNCDDAQTGDYYAYREGGCVGYGDNYRSWDSSDDMIEYIPEGATIRVEGGIDVYIVKYINGKMFKRLVLSPSVFENYEHLRWEDVMNVSSDVLDVYTTSDLVRSVITGNVYKLYPNGDCGVKRLVECDGCFWNNMDGDSIYWINGFDEDSYMDGYPLG